MLTVRRSIAWIFCQTLNGNVLPTQEVQAGSEKNLTQYASLISFANFFTRTPLLN